MSELTGIVDVRVTGVGSKSEMRSVVLLIDDSEGTVVTLRRREAVALDAEEQLAAYRGHRVRVTGDQVWTTFVVDRIEALESPAG